MHKELRVLICKDKHGAFVAVHAAGHARQAHSTSLSAAHEDELEDYCRSNHVQWDLHSAPLPAPRGPPVQGIPYVKGLACTAGPDACSYCCRSKATMQRHIRENHPEATTDSFIEATVQTLFEHVGHQFFQVCPELSEIAHRDPFTTIVSDFIPSMPAVPVLPARTERERTPFMKVLNWDLHMSEYRESRTQRTLALSLLDAPAEDEPHLRLLGSAVEKYIRGGMELSMAERQSLTVRKHLVHGKSIPNGGKCVLSFLSHLSDNPLTLTLQDFRECSVLEPSCRQ